MDASIVGNSSNPIAWKGGERGMVTTEDDHILSERLSADGRVRWQARRSLDRGRFGDLGVPVLALGGYGSQTYVDDVIADVRATGRPAVLLYAGDHDPSGEDIDRDFTARTDCWDEVRRVALTAAQVERYALPPQPGKDTDSRAAGFIARHGRLVQVELDALPPDVLRALYADAIAEFWNDDAHEAALEREAAERRTLAARRTSGMKPSCPCRTPRCAGLAEPGDLGNGSIRALVGGHHRHGAVAPVSTPALAPLRTSGQRADLMRRSDGNLRPAATSSVGASRRDGGAVCHRWAVPRVTTAEGATPLFCRLLGPVQGSLPPCVRRSTARRRSPLGARECTEVLGRVEAPLAPLAAARPRHVLRASVCWPLSRAVDAFRVVAGRDPRTDVRPTPSLVCHRTLHRRPPTSVSVQADPHRRGL
jgi:hypothetical protein